MIKTKEEYEAKLKRFGEIFHAGKGTKEGDEAEKLGIEIEGYENINFPLPKPSKEDMDNFHKDQSMEE